MIQTTENKCNKKVTSGTSLLKVTLVYLSKSSLLIKKFKSHILARLLHYTIRSVLIAALWSYHTNGNQCLKKFLCGFVASFNKSCDIFFC